MNLFLFTNVCDAKQDKNYLLFMFLRAEGARWVQKKHCIALAALDHPNETTLSTHSWQAAAAEAAVEVKQVAAASRLHRRGSDAIDPWQDFAGGAAPQEHIAVEVSHVSESARESLLVPHVDASQNDAPAQKEEQEDPYALCISAFAALFTSAEQSYRSSFADCPSPASNASTGAIRQQTAKFCAVVRARRPTWSDDMVRIGAGAICDIAQDTRKFSSGIMWRCSGSSKASVFFVLTQGDATCITSTGPSRPGAACRQSLRSPGSKSICFVSRACFALCLPR